MEENLEVAVEGSYSKSMANEVRKGVVRNACYCTVGLACGIILESIFWDLQPGLTSVGALATGLTTGVQEGKNVAYTQDGLHRKMGYGSLAGVISCTSGVIGYTAGASLVRCMRMSCF